MMRGDPICLALSHLHARGVGWGRVEAMVVVRVPSQSGNREKKIKSATEKGHDNDAPIMTAHVPTPGLWEALAYAQTSNIHGGV